MLHSTSDMVEPNGICRYKRSEHWSSTLPPYRRRGRRLDRTLSPPFLSTWTTLLAISSILGLALFPPSTWNHHDASLDLLPRSSNMAVGWHNGFRSLVRCSNPTIWSFLDALKLEQGLTDQKIAERLLLHPAPPRSKKWVNLDNKLQEFINA